jgi:hypothetical protein
MRKRTLRCGVKGNRVSNLAFHTLGVLREPNESPTTRAYFELGAQIFDAAVATDGFVARTAPFTDPVPNVFDPACHVVGISTLTVWRDLESAFAFAYDGTHVAAFRRRGDWFIKRDWSSYVAWWVEDGVLPTAEDAIARFEHLHANGPTPYAFTFKRPFDAIGRPTLVDRTRVAAKRQTVR